MSTQTETIYAPFSPEQVDLLNRFQRSGRFHGFTCAEHSSHLLIATSPGWYCQVDRCSYTQGWAHAFMADEDLIRHVESTDVLGRPRQ